MANKRQLVKRRKAVRNIRKITRTMQLIATARFQAMLKRATAGKPYARKLTELVETLSGIDVELEDSLLEAHGDEPRDVLIVLTSNRGLCGGYNAHVLRTAIGHIDAKRSEGMPCDVTMVGRKGINYFKFLKKPVAEGRSDFGDKPVFEPVRQLADGLMDRFRTGQITSVHVAYMRFISTGRQRAEVMQLLPLGGHTSPVESGASSGAGAGPSGVAGRSTVGPEYEFSPEPKKLLEALLPATVRLELFQCFMDAAVSEQVSRMVAMKAATDAAGDMITFLSRKYNRARQTQITMELLDIIGGAAAIE